MEILKEGDRGTALAPDRGRVRVTYRYRTLTLDSGVRVDDVLVGVDDEGEVLTVPAQSTPKIREARHQVKEATVSVRIPRELDDILWLASDTLEANPSKFGPAAVRFYLHEALHDNRLARRLHTLSRHRIACGRASKKLTLRADTELLESVAALSRRQASTRSDLVRGAVVAMKEDVFDGRAPRRRDRLEAVARAL